jgi:hypothetical protein
MKVAIYARYSSENQREASIADQFRICREFAKRQGWTIAKEYSDAAVSGATLLRSGFQAMMASALRKEVDVVLAESLDRFSRDQEDTAGLFKRLTFAGVSIVTLAEGDITFLHIGLKGTMNAMFLRSWRTRHAVACVDASSLARRALASASAIASFAVSRTAWSLQVNARSFPKRPTSFDASSSNTSPAHRHDRSRRT